MEKGKHPNARQIAQGQKSGTVDPQLKPEIAVALLMGGLTQALNTAITAKKRPAKSELLNNIWRFTVSALQLQGGQT